MPFPPLSGNSAIAIALGESHTCAIVTGGALKCWGRNDYGQLGIWSTSTQYYPQNVLSGMAMLDNVLILISSVIHSCIIIVQSGHEFRIFNLI